MLDKHKKSSSLQYKLGKQNDTISRSLPLRQTLDRLYNEWIIVHTLFSKWTTLILPVVKIDETINICGDFKQIIIRFMLILLEKLL